MRVPLGVLERIIGAVAWNESRRVNHLLIWQERVSFAEEVSRKTRMALLWPQTPRKPAGKTFSKALPIASMASIVEGSSSVQ